MASGEGAGGFPGGFPGFPAGGMPGMNPEMLQAILQDPNIRRMTEAISQDPVFQELARDLQSQMGGLSLEGEGAEAEGAAAAGIPGLGPDGMPAIDPAKYMQAMQRVMENPEFLSAAENLGKSMMSQAGGDPEMAGMMELFSNPNNQELLKERMSALKDDPEIGDIIKDMEENGQQAMMKYFNDPEKMAKVGRKFEEIMQDPEFRAQLTGGAEETVEAIEDNSVIGLASAGDDKALKALLAEEGSDPNEKDEEGRSALHFASGYDELLCMEVLLNAGADVNAKDENDNTALHYAAGYGNVKAAEVLLKHKADVEIKNKEGKTAVEVAELNEQEDLVKVLKGK